MKENEKEDNKVKKKKNNERKRKGSIRMEIKYSTNDKINYTADRSATYEHTAILTLVFKNGQFGPLITLYALLVNT